MREIASHAAQVLQQSSRSCLQPNSFQKMSDRNGAMRKNERVSCGSFARMPRKCVELWSAGERTLKPTSRELRVLHAAVTTQQRAARCAEQRLLFQAAERVQRLL